MGNVCMICMHAGCSSVLICGYFFYLFGVFLFVCSYLLKSLDSTLCTQSEYLYQVTINLDLIDSNLNQSLVPLEHTVRCLNISAVFGAGHGSCCRCNSCTVCLFVFVVFSLFGVLIINWL